MELPRQKTGGPEEDPFQSLVEAKKRLPLYQSSIFLRAMGFALVGLALLIMYAWQKQWLAPFFNQVSFGVAGIGLLVYMIGRVRAFAERKRKG